MTTVEGKVTIVIDEDVGIERNTLIVDRRVWVGKGAGEDQITITTGHPPDPLAMF
jgi:hypothetical protein